MNQPTTDNAASTLKLSRQLNASPQTVFDYFTQPEHLSEWFAPDPSMTTEIRRLDLTVGGQFELAMINPANEESYVLTGEYREIEPGSRLVYTWHWKSEPGDEVSQVTLSFKDHAGGTLLELCHERFATEESRDKHGQGWAACLSRLESAVA